MVAARRASLSSDNSYLDSSGDIRLKLSEKLTPSFDLTAKTIDGELVDKAGVSDVKAEKVNISVPAWKRDLKCELYSSPIIHDLAPFLLRC